jgi:hypothetical protein
MTNFDPLFKKEKELLQIDTENQYMFNRDYVYNYVRVDFTSLWVDHQCVIRHGDKYWTSDT